MCTWDFHIDDCLWLKLQIAVTAQLLSICLRTASSQALEVALKNSKSDIKCSAH